ncbi:hypothetical protein [Thermus tengchongensis]|uniref:Uncharacterized protein n=2 Tax=Thermus TaxID=270 RepID=A0A4Y9FAQ7_9DEIN|nr:hypothetical protein [Thermus tengchongensis]TFU26171.1 hypothetical protein E0687_07205 [Thermus tengchongensis]
MSREELKAVILELLREDPEVRASLAEVLRGVRPRPLEEAARGIAEVLAEAEREWLARQERRSREEA